MIERKGKFWGDSKKSHRWSWGNVRWQTVPEAATSHRKCSISDGGQPCTTNHQLRGWRRPKTAAVGVGGALDVVGKIPWRQTVQASVNQHSQLEIDAFRRPQPVKVLQHRCDVLIPRRSMYNSGGGVEHRLKATELGRRKPCECCVWVTDVTNAFQWAKQPPKIALSIHMENLDPI